MNMDKPNLVKGMIEEALSDAQVTITSVPGTGNGDHIGLMIVSDAFEGKSKIDQHRVIMEILNEHLVSGHVHAVQLKTYTHAKYKALQQKDA